LVVTRHCPVEMRRSNWWVLQLLLDPITQQQTACKQHDTDSRCQAPSAVVHPH
jgi:hypothetical protein